MNVRPAVPSDIPTLLALVRRYWDFEGIEGFAALPLELLLKRLLADPQRGAVWVAAAGPQLVGYLIAVLVMSVEHQGLMAEIDELFVLPEARSQGIGGALLAAAEQHLAALGCARLQLQLALGNRAGLEFYRQRGFTPREGYQLLDKPLTPL